MCDAVHAGAPHMQHRNHETLRHGLHHRISIVALVATALIIGACADQAGGTRLATEPGDTTPVASYVTTGSAAVVNPKTHRLEAVNAPPGHRGWRARAAMPAGRTLMRQCT